MAVSSAAGYERKAVENEPAAPPPVSQLRLSAEERSERPVPRLALWGAAGLVALSLALLAVYFLSSAESSTEGPAPSAAAPAPAKVASAAAPAADLAGGILAGGRVESAVRLELSVAQPGIVERVLVARGDRVKARDVLLELRSDDARAETELRRAALASATARLSELVQGARAEEIQAASGEVAAAEATYADAVGRTERDRKLAASGSVALSQKEQSEAQLQVAKARLEQARARLAMLTRGARSTSLASAEAEVARARAELAKAEAQLAARQVVAPVDGVVMDVKLGPGETATAEAPAVVLSDLEHLLVKADVPEAHTPRIRVGAKAQVIVEALPGRTFQAEVSQVALEADRQSGTVEVSVRLLQKDDSIRPRMSARVSITPTDTP